MMPNQKDLAPRARPTETLLHFIGPPGRARLLCALLLADPHQPMWLRQLSRAARVGFSGLDSELRYLEGMRMITRSRCAGVCYIALDESHPLVPALRAVIDAANLTDDLRQCPPRFAKGHTLNTGTGTLAGISSPRIESQLRRSAT